MSVASLEGFAPRHRKGRIVSNGESSDCFIFNARALARDVMLMLMHLNFSGLISICTGTLLQNLGFRKGEERYPER